ncbi:MAG: DUF2958 domain-containing protein [Candidatus Omnitrophica bacterium]|nr:DUF2958 domain-containing protein [Candidatus Omnitrophota bacterium]
MELITKELEARFPPLYAMEDKKPKEVKIIAKFFDPCGSWTWYATEYDPVERIFFGLVRGHEVEMGYFSLDELEAVKGRLGLGIERDLYFGDHTLAEAMEGTI